MAKIYDRIPVILKQRDQTTWLGVSRLPDQGAGQGDLLATLQPYLAGMKL